MPGKKFMNGLVWTRPDERDQFDELFANHIDVHMEMMDDKTLWIGLRRAGIDDEVHVTISAAGKLAITAHEA